MKNPLNKLLIFMLLLAGPALLAQDSEDWNIKLGKRKHNIFARKIQEINLGSTISSYHPLFFKIGEEGEWQRVGTTGKKILPYIPSTEFSSDYFKRYQRKKIKSYWCLGLSTASLLAWEYSSIDYLFTRRSSLAKAFLNPRSLAFFGGYLGLYILGVHWNAKGDLDLFMAITGEQVEAPKQSVSWHIGAGADGSLLVGLRF